MVLSDWENPVELCRMSKTQPGRKWKGTSIRTARRKAQRHEAACWSGASRGLEWEVCKAAAGQVPEGAVGM